MGSGVCLEPKCSWELCPELGLPESSGGIIISQPHCCSSRCCVSLCSLPWHPCPPALCWLEQILLPLKAGYSMTVSTPARLFISLCSLSSSESKGSPGLCYIARQTNLEKLQLCKIHENYDSLFNRDGQMIHLWIFVQSTRKNTDIAA